MILQIPQKVIYAIMAVLELALHHGSPPLQAKVIARRQAIPLRFIEYILNSLKHAGIIQGLRGSQGGYLLRQDPTQVSLATIVDAMGKPHVQHQSPSSMNGTHKGKLERRTHHEALLSTIWDQVRAAEFEILESITLQTLADQYRQLEQERAPMYHI